MKIIRIVLSIATLGIGPFTAYAGVIVYSINGFQGREFSVEGLLATGLTPLALVILFLAAIWRGGRKITLIALGASAIALAGTVSVTRAGLIRETTFLVAYLAAMILYFGVTLRKG